MPARIANFSSVFAATVNELAPEWSVNLSLSRHKKSGWSHYTLRLADPISSSETTDIFLLSGRREVTLVYGESHRHFEAFGEKTPKQVCAEAVMFVKSITEGKVASISWWQGDFIKASTFDQLQHTPMAPFGLQFSHVRVRQWPGKVHEAKA